MSRVANIIKKGKSIPLDKFINIALYDKKEGYYVKNNPFGKRGDFITSPLVSNLFAEMIAVWCVAFWENLGKPKKILLIELGPGDGSLCKDLLKTFQNFKDFYNCMEIRLLEISHKLKKIQKTKINEKKVKWINNIDNIDYGPIIFLGNEFFDSLAIKQIYKKNNLLLEKFISLSNNKKKVKFLYKKADKDLVNSIKKLKLISSGKTIEYPVDAIKFLKKIAIKINKFDGGLLAIDYGYTKKKNSDTVQGIKKHKFFSPFSISPTNDITSHVNFSLFAQILKKNNLNVEKIVNQSSFLQKIGILNRANIISKNMTFKMKANMFYRLNRLLNTKEMGSLFKVLFAQKKNGKFSLGF